MVSGIEFHQTGPAELTPILVSRFCTIVCASVYRQTSMDHKRVIRDDQSDKLLMIVM